MGRWYSDTHMFSKESDSRSQEAFLKVGFPILSLIHSWLFIQMPSLSATPACTRVLDFVLKGFVVCMPGNLIQKENKGSKSNKLQSAKLLCPWDFLAKTTGMDCHAFLQGIFLIQGSNQGLLHCRHILYCLSHWGSPWIVNLMANLQH